MTDFTKIDLTVASTRMGQFHSVGFDVQREDWPAIKKELEAHDPHKTVKLHEEQGPRNKYINRMLSGDYMWVWVVMTAETPITVLLCLAELSRDPLPTIHPLPNQYP